MIQCLIRCSIFIHAYLHNASYWWLCTKPWAIANACLQCVKGGRLQCAKLRVTVHDPCPHQTEHIANFWEVDSLSFANLDLGYYAIGFLGIACMGHEWCMHGLNFASWGVAHECIHAQCKLSSSFSSSSEPPHGTTVSEQVYRCSISVNHGQANKQQAIRKTMLQPDSATITLSYDQTAHFASCWACLRCFTLLQANMTLHLLC